MDGTTSIGGDVQLQPIERRATPAQHTRLRDIKSIGNGHAVCENGISWSNSNRIGNVRSKAKLPLGVQHSDVALGIVWPERLALHKGDRARHNNCQLQQDRVVLLWHGCGV